MNPFGDDVLERIRTFRARRDDVPDVEYWRRLNPECHISDSPFPGSPEPYPICPEAMKKNLARIRKEGYFQTEPVVEPAEVEKLRRCVAVVVTNGHPPGYALVYDEFYRVMARLGSVLSPVLGPDFQLVPDECDAYHVPADGRAAGSPPHRDTLRTATSVEPDGTPTLVNVWVPLTDATALNSCIYVLPAHLDPHYPHRGGAMSPDRIDLRGRDLPNVRALPARAGSVLCWGTHLLHWGARSSEHAAGPRVSFATYYQSRRVPPYHEVTMDIPSPLPFARRLRLIEKVWCRTLGGPPGAPV